MEIHVTGTCQHKVDAFHISGSSEDFSHGFVHPDYKYSYNSYFKLAASSENVSSYMREMRRFRSSCTFVKYHPGLCSSFIHPVVSNNPVCGQRWPRPVCADTFVRHWFHMWRLVCHHVFLLLSFH